MAYVGVALTPSMFAIGWFMKTRVAFLVNLGTLVGWFILVPVAVFLNTVYDAQYQANVPIQYYAEDGARAFSQMIASQRRYEPLQSVQLSVVECLVLQRCGVRLPTSSRTLVCLQGEGSQEYMEGKGWYEWPLMHIPIFMGLTFSQLILIFWVGGFDAVPIIFATSSS